MHILSDMDSRYALTNELHARPFPEIDGPAQVITFALTLDGGADAARAELIELLDRFGADHPPPGDNHYYGPLGRNRLKWELHSEFVTYTQFVAQEDGQPFRDDLMSVFPGDWLEKLQGRVITATQISVQYARDCAEVENRMRDEIRNWFVGESLAAAYVLERNAVVVGDFRIDEAGHVRFALIGLGDIGPRRMGRLVQRVQEIETYKAMAMLTLPVARKVFAEAGRLGERLSEVATCMTDPKAAPRETLEDLLKISSEVELLSSESSYRFSAGRAYRAIVDQRIKVLREERILERQLFSEFMMRRFEPAMRTCDAAEKRLEDLSTHSARASELLSTRVNVAVTEQNRQLLESMNRRAALQMRLQETVEGLSVVAISYYAVNLLLYLLGPLAKHYGLGKTWLAAALVPPVMGGGWLMVRRIKAHVARAFDDRVGKDRN